jgi:ribulose-phosphate 3-epimerase
VKLTVAPSILAADFSRLGEEIARVEEAGADWLHVDVMDGHFVPNITMGPMVVEAIREVTRLPLDVHLMIANPDRYLDVFADAGATSIAVHAEACPHLHRTLTRLRELGRGTSVAINPSTPVSAVAEVVHLVDQILIMSVNPGFTGQTFIPESVRRIEEARALVAARRAPARIQVDGGVRLENVASVVEAGATILVAGAAVFHAPDAAQAVRDLRAAAAGK